MKAAGILSAIAAAVAAGCAGSAGRRAQESAGADLWTMTNFGGRPLAVLERGPDSGAAAVTLLCVHGLGGTALEFAPLAAELPPGVRLVAPDLPGTGRSAAAPEDRCDVQLFVSVLSELLGRETSARVVLVGHSLGGKIAAVFATRHAAAVGALVLIAPYGLEGQERAVERAIARRRWLVGLTAALNNRLVIRSALRRVYYDRDRVPEPIVRHALDSQLTAGGRAAMAAVAHALVGRDPIDALLPGVAQPTLLLWGREDRVLPPQAAARYAALIPGARLELIDRCGHVPMVEQPVETARLLAAFLREVGLLAR